MRKYAATKACGALVALAILGIGVAEADFVITLRNGKEIIADHSEEVGDKVVYHRYGGKVTVPRSLIAEIEDRTTGKKLVYNPLYTVQERRQFHESQVWRLRKMERQEKRKIGLQLKEEAEQRELEQERQLALEHHRQERQQIEDMLRALQLVNEMRRLQGAEKPEVHINNTVIVK